MPNVTNQVQTSYNTAGLMSSANPNYLAVAADFTNAAWNTVATQEVFVVTGLCRLRMWIEVTGNVDSALHGATVCFGHEGDTDLYIANTDETELDANDLWYSPTPVTLEDAFSNVVIDRVINGLDVGIEIKVEALNAGSMTFYCIWEPLEAGAGVVVGAGGAL